MHDINKLLVDEGVRGVLRWLNAGVPHRYTAAYEVRGELLHSLYVFDKLDPAIKPFDDAPIAATYCDLIWTSKAPVKIVDAYNDEAAKLHAAFPKAKSYCGAPLRNNDKTPWGTLCHFDLASQPIDDLQWQQLLAAAEVLGKKLWLIKPPA